MTVPSPAGPRTIRAVFTGIVERAGAVRAVQRTGAGLRIRVDLGPLARGCRRGESISVAGVCLTLVGKPLRGAGAFDIVAETLDRTTLGSLRRGSRVNLERALRVGDRLGGHFVQGHVDGVGTVRSFTGGSGDRTLSVAAPRAVRAHLVPRGSVTVDGVSLTVAGLDARGFSVALVPQTLEVTTFAALRRGSCVNLEADLLGKWVRHLLAEGFRTS